MNSILKNIWKKSTLVQIVLLLGTVNSFSQNAPFLEWFYIGSSDLNNIKFQDCFLIKKTGGSWGANVTYTLTLPVYQRIGITGNTQSVLVGPTITAVGPNILSKPITQDAYDNSFAVIEFKVPTTYTQDQLYFYLDYTINSSVTIGVSKPDDNILDSYGSDINRYLLQTEYCKTTSEMEDEMDNLVGNSTVIYDVVEKITRWVFSHIKYRESNVQLSNDIYYSGEGDCDGMSNLAVALIRSRGIPARVTFGQSVKKQIVYPDDFNSSFTLGGGNGSGQTGSHGAFEVYYPSIGWVPGDIAQRTSNFWHATNIFFYEGPDYINLVNTWSLHLDGYYTGNETQPSSVTYGYLENKVTNIPSLTTNFTFQSSENFTGTVVYNCPGNVLMSSSKNNIPIGINDYISLENPPSGSGVPNNTYNFDMGNQLSFYCKFYDVDEHTTVVQRNWKIQLYNSSGTYTLLSQSTTDGYWQPICPASIPEDFWSRDETGKIIGDVIIECLDSDGYTHSDQQSLRIGYKPDAPRVDLISKGNNSLTLNFNCPGTNTYKIYYGNNNYTPYSGTGYHQGNSPINVGNLKTYSLSNATCGNVIKVTATNSYGESTYSAPIILTANTKIPYSTGFETGVDNCWSLKSNTAYGSVNRSSTSSFCHSGSYGLAIASSSGIYSQNYADLHLSLVNEPNVILEFWWKNFNDEFNENKDAIWLSDDGGGSFVKVFDLNSTIYNTWINYKLDIIDLAHRNGIHLNSNFVIRFSQYDNYFSTASSDKDGFAFDDISVYRGIYAKVNKDAVIKHNLNPNYTSMDNTNYGSYPLLVPECWTHSGYFTANRALLAFELSGIPITGGTETTITYANLSLFSPVPQSSDEYKHFSNAIMGTSGYKSNASYIKRITSTWNESDVTWNNQPTTTSTNQVLLNQSTTNNQNYLNIDVKNIINDICKGLDGNNGMMLMLQNENYYSRMSFASSDFSDNNLHPKLDLKYESTSHTLTLSPSKDATLFYNANPNYSSQAFTNYGNCDRYMAEEWTNGGYRVNAISVFDFDLSSLPCTAIITDAKLSLYACNPQTNNEYKQMSNLSTGSSNYKSNACWLKRIITNWDENTVTYYTKPSFSTENQVYLPISDIYTQNYIDIDVTELVNDIRNNNSFGFMMQLDKEEKYSNMAFASTDHPNTALHPKLVIKYILSAPAPTPIVKSPEKNPDFVLADLEEGVVNCQYVYPNPVKDMFYINVPNGNFEITIFDISGKVIYASLINEVYSVDCSTWQQGLYNFKLIDKTTGEVHVSKFVKL